LQQNWRIKPGGYDLHVANYETSDPERPILEQMIVEPAAAQFTGSACWVDILHAHNGPTPGTVPSYFEIDARIAWHVNSRLELSPVRTDCTSVALEEGFPDPACVAIERSTQGEISIAAIIRS
jgi:hypothetical protein